MSSDALLLVLHILLVCHLVLLLGSHSVARCHPAASRHACLWSRDLCMVDIFRGVDGRFGVNTILVSWSGLGRIEACLETGALGRVRARWRDNAAYLDQVFTLGFCDERL